MIEMLITTVIVGVVAALAIPSFQTAYDRHLFKSGQQEVSSLLRKARSYAISNKAPYGVYFDNQELTVTLFANTNNPSVNSYEDADSAVSVDSLPTQFQYVYTDDETGAIVFQPNGSSLNPGYTNIYLMGETDGMTAYFSINILASTGRINTYSNFYAW
jgi:Tfp pilus assembly protein FimT